MRVANLGHGVVKLSFVLLAWLLLSATGAAAEIAYKCSLSGSPDEYSRTLIPGKYCKVVAVAPPNGWTVISTDDASVTMIHEGTARQTEQGAKVWVMTTYYYSKGGPGSWYLSTKSLLRINCKAATAATLSTTTYGGRNGEGDVIFSGQISQPVEADVAPDTIGSLLLERYCPATLGR